MQILSFPTASMSAKPAENLFLSPGKNKIHDKHCSGHQLILLSHSDNEK